MPPLYASLPSRYTKNGFAMYNLRRDANCLSATRAFDQGVMSGRNNAKEMIEAFRRERHKNNFDMQPPPPPTTTTPPKYAWTNELVKQYQAS